MKNNLLKYNLTAFVIFIAAAICPAQRPPSVGGYKETSKTDQMVVAAANFAVETQREKDASLKLVAIKRAARQVVQGSNYEMCLAVTSENKPQEATAVVYHDLQNNFSLTSWSSEKCAAGAEDKLKPAAKTPAKKTTKIKVYLVAYGDNGKTGEKFGCDDSLVPVTRTIKTTRQPLKSAIEELLAIPFEYNDKLSNHWGVERGIKVKSISIKKGTATINLIGSPAVAGICDEPRIMQQVIKTAMQFPTVKAVKVFVDGKPLEEAIR